MSSSSSLVWFLLVGADGENYQGTSADAVALLPSSIVLQFRDAVKAKNPNTLSSVDASKLKVFRNKAAFDAKEEPLRSSTPLNGRGSDEDDALIVLVPEQPAQREAARPLTREDLDDALEKHDQKKEKTATYAITSINTRRWREISTKARLKVICLDFEEPIGATPSIPAYNWIDNVAEDNELQRNAYMDYLQTHLGPRLPEGFSIVDVALKKRLFSIQDARLPFHLTGGTDVLIVDRIAKKLKHPLMGIRMVIELKREIEMDNMCQTYAEMLAADIVSSGAHSVVGMLTDLRNDWRLMWLERGEIIVAPFAQAANAFDFIQQVLKVDWRKEVTLPMIERPMKRARFDDFMHPVADDRLEEELERYELMADELEPEFLHRKRLEFAHAVVKRSPVFMSMYS